MIRNFSRIVGAMLLAGFASSAFAEGPDVSVNAGVVSDYRFRGISLSDREPALQGGVDVEAGPLFAGVWGSTIADYEGAEAELDVYGGVHGRIGEFDWRVGAYAYVYPGGDSVNYVEFTSQLDRAFGPVTLGLEAALAPEQAHVDAANRYFGASSAYDIGAGWSVGVRGGYERGFYARKWDWEIALGYSRGPFTASVAYVDSNHGAVDEAGRLGRGGVVGALLAEF